MKLTPLLQRFESAPALKLLVDRIREEGTASIGAVVESARPAVTAFLAQNLKGSVILVSAHQHRAEHLVQELTPWLDMPVELFPAFESLPYERAPLDKETLARRQAVVNRLGQERIAVVTSVRALLQSVHLPRPDESLNLRVGDEIDPGNLDSSLYRGGYDSAPVVEEVGDFARRGGIVDVFPVGASHPIRVEFLGNQIDSIRSFDPSTQRSLERIESLVIQSMTDFDPQIFKDLAQQLDAISTENLTEAALQRWLDDVERLYEGEVEDAQFFAPYLNRNHTLIDAAGSSPDHPTLVAFEAVEDAWLSVDELVAQASEFQESLVASGELPPGLLPPLVPEDVLRDALESVRRVEFTRGGGGEDVEARVFIPAPAYGGRIRDFIHSLDHSDGRSVSPTSPLLNSSNSLVVTSYQHARLSELLAADGVSVTVLDDLQAIPESGQIAIVKGSLAQGWVAPDLGIELYTDHEIFGWSKPRATQRRRKAPRETFFTEFTSGDYVVHIEHGIGQLVGTTKMRDAGVEREYLEVQYAGSDRLYVPTDQLDRLTRYVGMGEAHPQLNKLGGGEWTRAKARAQKAAEDMAEELIALYAQREANGGHSFMPDTPWQRELEGSFPFEETPDQMQAILDVKSDMEQPRPMDRLVVADVGYGKTEVAVRATFKAVMEGMQSAILVPTTVLAQQHLETFKQRLEAFPIRVEMLSRFRSPKEQRDVLKRVEAGEVDVVIGTHRLLGKDVRFQNLGLLVVDEEQRFGVRHKERLKQLRAEVDVLTLTATPIPRTLHMSLTGIRDVSIIQTPPEGRLPIKTYLQPYEDRLVREALIRELEREGQIYFVHNRVAGIEALAQKLRRLTPEARILVGHGQMPEDALEKVMLAFAHNEADVLLCSTIIESGLDIPNVNTIVIDHAEALGLGQLYQLRGRVGRGVNQAYAYLLYPRDARIGKDAMRRMEAVFEATELGAGFRIAMADLEIRGAGNLLGSEQSGHVAAIGFDLYTNLLKDAIDRQRGQTKIESPHVTVDLPFDVLIPAAYVSDERERLTLYRRLASIKERPELGTIRAELRDRFGPLPSSVDNLIKQVEIKLLGEQAHVTSVVLRGDTLTIRGERRILFDRLALYKRFGMGARIDEHVLRIEASKLGPDWVQTIEEVLSETAALRERQSAAVATPAAATPSAN